MHRVVIAKSSPFVRYHTLRSLPSLLERKRTNASQFPSQSLRFQASRHYSTSNDTNQVISNLKTFKFDSIMEDIKENETNTKEERVEREVKSTNEESSKPTELSTILNTFPLEPIGIFQSVFPEKNGTPR